jgi:ABC-type Fe3+ transport system permease subunit
MISPALLERPGWWRMPWIMVCLLFGLLPILPLLWGTITPRGLADIDPSFRLALRNSFLVAAAVGFLSFMIGLPLGVTIALNSFPGRRTLLAALALPMLVPSVLWAIGWTAMSARFSTVSFLASGITGCTTVLLAGALPLVVFATLCALNSLSQSQLEAARLAGGERAVMRYSGSAAVVPAVAAAGLAGVLTLSDPGPGQILGLRTASSEILTSFAALYDYELAARQCASLTLIVMVIAFPLALLAAPRFGSQLLGRQLRGYRLQRPRRSWIMMALCGLPLLILIALPVLGMVLPLRGLSDFVWAWREVQRTAMNTLLYAAGAGVIAAACGCLIAVSVGRQEWLRTVVLACSVAIVVLPPAAMALGVLRAGTYAPQSFDAVLRSRLTVTLALAARFFPVTAILFLHAWQTTPASWNMAASVHGVSLLRFVWRILLSRFLPVFALAVLLVVLLGSADVGTVLLLHPPGETSLPLAIFTVMANASESLVASLCVSYLALATMGLWLMMGMVTRRG